MTAIVGRISFDPGGFMEIIYEREAKREDAQLVIATMLQGLGIVRSDSDLPIPCFDLDELHRRSAFRRVSQEEK